MTSDNRFREGPDIPYELMTSAARLAAHAEYRRIVLAYGELEEAECRVRAFAVELADAQKALKAVVDDPSSYLATHNGGSSHTETP